ncbi:MULTISPECIES: CSS-motif domain-containing protein [unclassified Pseudomonas]|uniref:CSS-motif domain-containing protein n=1 Tax=unclassified Pseudomonas TaxID=196821 RepID=UPI000483B2DB|nr:MULTISPECIES: CSS-motif domain-containing protein [unclassified Pseudomonas]RAS25008.1 CSS domain containing protein [Pseudomonas sp. URMO17WK12:I7]SMF03202.1 CSS motif domain associated with EAL [Pseudomonas sp. URMO17WK12:I5]
MSRFKTAGQSLVELLLTLVISLLPVCTGLIILFYQQDKKFEETSRISVNEAIYSVDLALDRIHDSASAALALAGTGCENAKPHLLDQVSKVPHLRSLALTVEGRTYCSTLGTPYSPDLMIPDAQSPFHLLLDPPATPDAVLLTYQLSENTLGVIATSYGILLRNELRAFQTGLTLLLEFGDSYIWTDGDSRDKTRPSQVEFFNEGVSNKYGYTVKAGYAQGYSAREARKTLIPILPSLALVGIITGSITYLGFYRQRKRVRSAASTA